MVTMPYRMSEEEPFIWPGKIDVPFHFYAGASGSKFLIALRDRKRIMGTRCPVCNRVYVPPKSTCGRCFSKLDEWVEVSDRGTLLTYTVVYAPEQLHPVAPPFAYGVIQLDGADTGISHILGEVDLENVSIGMRLQAVFKEERAGNILDIKYFKPL